MKQKKSYQMTNNTFLLKESSNLEYIEKAISSEMGGTINTRNKAFLISATILASVSSVNASDFTIVNDNSNSLEITHQYDKLVNQPLIKYIDDISNVPESNCISKNTLIKNILSFKSLQESWDGRGAIPLEVESAVNTIDLLGLVGEKTFCLVNDYYPNTNGTITLEWTNNENEIVSIEVGNQTFSYFVDLLSEKTLFFNNIEINAKEAKKLANFIEAL
jgi:hypothetical protein